MLPGGRVRATQPAQTYHCFHCHWLLFSTWYFIDAVRRGDNTVRTKQLGRWLIFGVDDIKLYPWILFETFTKLCNECTPMDYESQHRRRPKYFPMYEVPAELDMFENMQEYPRKDPFNVQIQMKGYVKYY